MRVPVETTTEIVVRQVRDSDSAGLIELIGGCYAEYPGCYLDVQEEPWLLEPASAYGRWRGRLWVVERDGRIVASGGLRPSGPGMQLGYVRSGGFRERQDLSHSIEYHFVKLLVTTPGRRRC